VDARAELALREVIRSVVSADLDELHNRIDRLEQSGRSFSYTEHLVQRRRAVVELRAAGLSIAAVAKQLGLAVSTVERDLDATEHTVPTYARGRDGKMHPTRKGTQAQA
jgi:DNA-binding NarL/FixJ family response regulator